MIKRLCFSLFFLLICFSILNWISTYKLIPKDARAQTFLMYGPLRGVITTALQWKIEQEHEKGNAQEVTQLTNWMLKMQPFNPHIWAYQSWNLGYNLVTYFPNPEERWFWTRRALHLLLSDAAHLRSDSIINEAIGEIINDKIAGAVLDPYTPFYREQFAKEMALFLPTGSLQDLGHYLDSQGHLTDTGRLFSEAYLLDFDIMRQVDSNFGPFDWRLPYAYVLYYKTHGDYETFKQGHFGANYTIYRAWKNACENGRLLLNPNDYTYLTTFDFRILKKIQAFLNVQKSLNAHENVQNEYQNFMRTSAAIFYINNQIDSAREMYDQFYIESLPKDRPSFDDFIASSSELLLNSERVLTQKTAIETALLQAFIAQESKDQALAIGYFKFARLLWQKNQETFKKEKARLLPPFGELLESARLLKNQLMQHRH